MKFVIPLEKMRNETIKMIAEDLGYVVYSEEAEKILKETKDPVKIKEVEERTIAELKVCMLDDDYMFDDDIYHITDEDFCEFFVSQEVTDIFNKIGELKESIEKLPVSESMKQRILNDCMIEEVYNKLCKRMIRYFEDRC
jgi:hypothetical protein